MDFEEEIIFFLINGGLFKEEEALLESIKNESDWGAREAVIDGDEKTISALKRLSVLRGFFADNPNPIKLVKYKERNGRIIVGKDSGVLLYLRRIKEAELSGLRVKAGIYYIHNPQELEERIKKGGYDGEIL